MIAKIVAMIAAMLAVQVASAASANVTAIDRTHAGHDLGAAVNQALTAMPGVLAPDATMDVMGGALIAQLPANATVRAVPKNVTALQPGEYSVIIAGVAVDGTEVAAGAPLGVTVGVDQVVEITLPPATPTVSSYTVYAGRAGAETLQAQELAPGAIVRLIDPTEFFNRRTSEVPYYPNGPGPPVIVRVLVAAYSGERLVMLGAEQELHVAAMQSLRVAPPDLSGLTFAVFASTGPNRERLQVHGLPPGSAYTLGALHDDGELLPSPAQRIEIAPGDYEQATMIVIDRPEVTLACATPTTIRVTHGFSQAAVLVNPAILGGSGDNVGIHRLHDVTIEGCTWDMSGQIETAATPPPDDVRNFSIMAWSTDELTLRGLTIRNNLRGGLSALSCSDVRIEDSRIERTRGRAQSDDHGRLLPGRGVGNAINVARNAPFSDPVGDAQQTRTIIANNLIVGDGYGEMYGIVVAAGGASENTITGNTISHLRGACIALEGQNAHDSGRTTISGNTCSDTGGIISDNASGGLADTEMRAVTITGNTVSASRAAGIAVSSSNTTVSGNVVDGCQFDGTASGCILITPPRPSGAATRAGTRNLLVADNVIALGAATHAQPPVGVYVNGAAPITSLTLAHNRIDCERTPNSLGVHLSGDVTDTVLHGNVIGDCGGDGVLVTDFSMVGVPVPQRLTASDNVFRNLNLSDRWMDGRHPVGAAFRFMIDGIGTTSAGHRLRSNQVTDESAPPHLRYGVIFDAERPGAITDVHLDGNEWNARTDDVYNTGATDVVVK
ncbi:MAG: right-handed parallel beta-helix repeat-containing protein [Deltaproteobacteria bacterium]|nr:right-handed parallel beta-helix repeat-containing protein [Deltaproteobacteria bacterium]MBI3390245.1 right-handed parallel beta-helix repeat-containing protein [Deltaproteobacteria bacterium]